MILLLACEDAKRVWDNPYDPRSDRSLWTPDTLQATQLSSDEIELSWLRKGRDFDGFTIDKKVGEGNWLDSVAILWDSTFNWVDKLDLKEVVNNPVEYAYRIYAYADSNISNKVSVKIKPATPGPPDRVDIVSVSYTTEPLMTIEWELSIEGDFAKYNLYKAKDSTGTQILIQSYDDKNTITHTMTAFDPTIENWFWVEVEDSTGQKTLGNGKGHPVDLVPGPVPLDSITYKGNQFFFNWAKSPISDFEQYVIEQITLPDSTVVDSSVYNTQETTSVGISVENDIERVYRVRVTDKWNQSAWSNVRGASSYQRVVKVDYIRDLGDDITISNMGPSLPFTHVLTNVNAQFPIWIQNGEKVFSLIDGGVGLLVNKNGTSLRTISGEKPQDIAFNLDQSMAVFTGTDHNIYIVNLDEDESPVKLTNETNNEWYGDPEFIEIEGSTLILYWQRIHQSNNNIGVKDIFTMDLDGKNVKQITNAQNIEKFILPRMSPDRAKILYALEGDGLYIMDYPGETVGVAVTKADGQKIMPVTSQYFRNIRWSYDSQKAILWSFENSSYFIYLFTLNANPPLTLLQSGGRYADWINDTNADTIIFRSESSDAMYIKDVSESSSKEPTLLYNAPWAQLQPRQ